MATFESTEDAVRFLCTASLFPIVLETAEGDVVCYNITNGIADYGEAFPHFYINASPQIDGEEVYLLKAQDILGFRMI